MAVFLLLAACTIGSSVPAGLEAPLRWEGATGWVHLVRDVDGDGRAEALIQDELGWMIVRSPLARSLSLPADALTTGSGLGPRDVMDLDGDGLADLRFFEGVALSPQPSTFDPAALVAGVFEGRPDDVTGDGVLDDVVLRGDPIGIEVRTGWPAWHTVFELVPSCADAWTAGYDPYVGDLERVPDLDGDGEDELWWAGIPYALTDECHGYLLPGDLAGEIDPDVVGVRQFPLYQLVGDQTGDGIRDLIDGAPPQVFAGPLTVGLDTWTAVPVFTPAAGARRVPFDLDGDGIGEWMTEREILTGGPAGGVATGVATVELPESEDSAAFWEEGEAWVLLVRDGGVDVIGLGPADEAPVR